MRVLIAEDDATSRTILRRHVAHLGYEAQVASDGLAAWGLVEEALPDVLITDWMMPGLDGVELCRRIRTGALAQLGYVYIIFVTALEDREHIEHAIEAGADDYLAKPLNRVDLSTRLRVAERVTSLYGQIAVAHHELEQLNRELLEQASQDVLTGLPNRRLFQDRLTQAINAAKRNTTAVSLLMIDLDGFKAINDTMGHEAGDWLLQAVAARLQALVRVSDTVARLGGDEFAVLLADTDEAGALQVAAKIASALAKPVALGARTGLVGASIGIALFPEHAATPDELMRNADSAMYEAKGAGIAYAVYAPEYQDASSSKHGLAVGTRQAIAGGELHLQYNPVVSYHTGAIERVEARVRWDRPSEDQLTSDRFNHVAAHSGLTIPLTVWTMEEAVKQCSVWQRHGITVGVSVNLAAANLEKSQLPDLVSALLRQYAVAAEDLTLEITKESLRMQSGTALATLDALAALGVRLSIDDFGTGHSSVLELRALPVKQIKLAHGFVTDLANEIHTNVLAFMIGLGMALDVTVVVKGVESQEVLDWLRLKSCESVQGVYVSPPLAAADLEQGLAARA
jgi:diguanylate cyclase (GGDEF)-like protein